MKNLKISEKVLLWLMLAMLVTNPVTGQLVLWSIDWAFGQFFAVSGYIGVVAVSYLTLFLVWKNRQADKPKTKGKNKSAGKYIATPIS